MKKLLCVLLTAVMLLAMIPSFVVSVSAAQICPAPTAGNVEITSVSYSEDQGVDWSVIWGDTNYNLDSESSDFKRCYSHSATPIEIIGKFAEPIVPEKIVFCSQYYGNRLSGVAIYVSVDGADWVKAAEEMGTGLATAWFKLFEYELDCGETEYNYIKIVTDSKNKNAAWSNVYTFDCPWVAVYAQPEQPNSSTNPSGKINVSHVSATDTSATWEKMWDKNNMTRLGGGLAAPAEFVGKFENVTRVTDIIVNIWHYPSRINGTTVSFSVDGQTWDSTALTISGLTNKDDSLGINGKQQYNFSVSTDKAYHYVKVASTTSANGNGTYWFDVLSFSFYNKPYNVADEDFEVVYGVSQNSKATEKYGDVSCLWNYNNTDYKDWGNNATDHVLITGEFATPTVIDNIYLKAVSGKGGRSAYMLIKASQDGVNWDEIAYSGNVANSTSDIFLESKSDKAYKFICLEEKNGYTCGLLSVGVVGTAQAPATNTTEADFYGVQTSVGESDWSLRLISTVDSLDFKAVGYEITVTGDAERTWDKYTQVVYSSVIDDIGTRHAQALGGKYIFTATINGISIEKYDTLTFEIKPYVADENGVKSYGKTVTYTFVDGVAQ